MSKNDKRELFFTEKDVSLSDFPYEPKLTAEFGFHHERFLNQIKRIWNKCEFVPTDVLGGFFSCKDEYDCLLSMKEDLENRINQAIDNIDKLLTVVSDETVTTELKQIKQNLWKTGKERWLEIFWNIERATNENKNRNIQAA